MNSFKHITKNTLLVVMIFTVAVGAFAATGAADNHSDEERLSPTINYNVDDLAEPEVPFGAEVRATGNGIVLEDSGEPVTYSLQRQVSSGEYEHLSVLGQAQEIDGEPTLVVSDTAALQSLVSDDPRGMYRLSSGVPEINAPSSQADNGVIELSTAYAPQDYTIRAYENPDGSYTASNRIDTATTDISAGNEVDSGSTFEVDTYSETTTIVVRLYDRDGNVLTVDGEPVSTTVTIDTFGASTETASYTDSPRDLLLGSSDDPGTETSDGRWELVQGTYLDDRVEIDAFDGTNPTLDRVWRGQNLRLADNSITVGEVYELIAVDDDGNEVDFLGGYEGEISPTVTTGEIEIDTEFIEENADYRLLDSDGNTVLEFTGNVQDLATVTEDTTVVNTRADDTTVDLGLESRRGTEFDVLMSVENIDEEEQLDEFELSTIIQDLDQETEVVNDTHIRIEDVHQSSDPEDLTLDFGSNSLDLGEHEVKFEVADASASDTIQIAVQDTQDRRAQFDKNQYIEQEGDVASFDVQFQATDQATFMIEDEEESFSYQFDIVDDNDDGEVVVNFDTYKANELGDVSRSDLDEIFYTEDSEDEIIFPSDTEVPRESLQEPISAATYSLQTNVDGSPRGSSSLSLVDRETEDVRTWVMPENEFTDLEAVRESATEQSTVANEDLLVVQIEASGIYSLVDNDTNPAALINYEQRDDVDEVGDFNSGDVGFNPDLVDVVDEFSVEIEDTDRPINTDPHRIKLEDAINLETDPVNESMYLFFDTEGENQVESFEDQTALPERDYEARINFTEEYKYIEDKDEADEYEGDESHDFSVIERGVELQLPTVDVEDSELDRRFGIPAGENTTIAGETEIAPGTRMDIVISSSDGADPPNYGPSVVDVQDNGTVQTEFNTSDAEIGRNATINFFPHSEDKPSIIVEENTAPEIVELTADSPVNTSETVAFTADVEDQNLDTLEYDWDFDNNETSALSDPVQSYAETGTYNVELTVTDSLGQTDSETVEVVVEEEPNQPPQIVSLIGPDEVETGQTANFGVVASDDKSTNNLTYSWDLGDGTTNSGVSVSHAYDVEGPYDVSVTATDEEGETTTETKTVNVVNSGNNAQNNNTNSSERQLTVIVQTAENEETIEGAQVNITDSSGAVVESGTTDSSGQISATVEDGTTYDISANAEGFEESAASIPIDGSDEEININLVSAEEEPPEQPGFPLLLAALALIAVGSVIYYRRSA